MRSRLVGLDRLRIGIDGRDAAGKSTFADAFAEELRPDRQVIRATVDDWQNSREVRYRRGRFSAEGYYLDGFDYRRLVAELLEPFKTGETIRLASHDIAADLPATAESFTPDANAILVLDGVFLQRPELRPHLDIVIHLYLERALALERGIARDSDRSGNPIEEQRLYQERYGPGQDLYFAEVDPITLADLVIDNSDFAAPVVIRG